MSVNHDEETRVQPDSMAGGLKILLPVLLLCLIAAAVFYMTKGDGGTAHHGGHGATDSTATHDEHANASMDSHEATDIHASKGKLDTLTGDFIYDLGENVTIDLPNNGGKITVGKNSTENKLVEFLNDKSAALDTVKGNWFEFTNVRFKSGGAEMAEGSEAQLKNLVAIAKAYPAAQFKIGGYTDNSGDKAKNLALSQKRAEAVAAKAKSLGAASIVGAEGYGVQWPIADNATAEGRAQNRRVAVNVKAK